MEDDNATQITFPLPREVLELYRFVSKDLSRSNLMLVRVEQDEEPGIWCAIATTGTHLIVVRWVVSEVLPCSFFLPAELCKSALRGARVFDNWTGIYHHSGLRERRIEICKGGDSHSGKFDSEQGFPPWRKVCPAMPLEGNEATNLIAFDLKELAILEMYIRKCGAETKTRWGIPDDSLSPLRAEIDSLTVKEITYILSPVRM